MAFPRASRSAAPRAACLSALLAGSLALAPSIGAEETPTPPPTPTAIATPTPDPTPAPAPPPTPVPTAPPAPLTIELSGLGDLQVTKFVSLKRLPVPFKVSQSARVRVDLTVTAAVGKRYGLKPGRGAKTVRIGTKTGPVPAPIWTQFDLPLSAAFKRHVKAKPGNFVVTITATSGKTSATATLPVTRRAQTRR